MKANAQAYRRGMVLGLTLAEIMLLLVFMMLLAAAFLLQRQQTATAALDDQAQAIAAAKSGASARIATLEAALAQTSAVAATAEQTRRQVANDAARQLATANANVVRLTAELAAARTDAQALIGQNAQMRGEIARINGNAGSGLPYCWTSPDGKPITLLRVTLRDDGVVAQDPTPRPRPDDRLWTGIAGLPRGNVLAMDAFLAQATVLIAQSTADRCRHAVDVIDATGPTNKRGYKGLMNQLWGHFLLREVGG